jgi:hypothetical protein
MRHFHKLLILIPLSLITLVGCGEAAKEGSKEATKKVETLASPASDVKTAVKKVAGEGVGGLIDTVTKTQAAIKAGDFKTAKTEFQAFEGTWKKIEDGIKAKSGKSYDAIEKSVGEVNGVLNASKPDKETALKALESLTKEITALPKSDK